MRVKKNFFLLILFLFATGTIKGNNAAIDDTITGKNSSSESTRTKAFSFGSNGKIVYHTQTGTFTVFVNDNEIISNAHALVSLGKDSLNSTDYTHCAIRKSSINNGFGKGKRIVVNLRAKGFPDMQQVFYTYANREYFLTEVIIKGNGLSSNYMAPVVSNRVDIEKSGDNRVLFVPFDNDTFIRYNSRSMENHLSSISSEVTAFYDNSSRRGLILGSVEHMVWKTGVKTSGKGNTLSKLIVWGGYTDVKVTRDSIEHGYISGKILKSPKIFVGMFDDWRNGLEEYGQANAIAEPRYVFDWPLPTPFGWNSWGAMQTGLDLKKAKAVVDFFADSLPTFRNKNTVYIDLDSYWDNMVNGGLEGDFSKLRELADYCKNRGLKPGIYWAPFVDWGKYDRKVEGSDYNYSDIWTKVNGGYHDLDGARAIDPTHPATRKRIDLVIGKFKKCGFEMIKIDFIGHAAIEADAFYDQSVKTGMQAFRKGMEYLIDALDGKMLVYVAISPSLATGRYAHVRRIACDAFSDINATQYTLNSTSYGWWQTYIYNYVDADHLVFGQASAGENRARLTSGLINGPLISGDDFSKNGPWKSQARKLFQNQELLAISRGNGKAFVPIEGNSTLGASEMFEKQTTEHYYLAIINYNEEKSSFTIQPDRLSLDGTAYEVKELYSGNTYFFDGLPLILKLEGRDAAILRFSKE